MQPAANRNGFANRPATNGVGSLITMSAGGWGSTLESGDGEVGGAAVAEGLQLGGETNGTL